MYNKCTFLLNTIIFSTEIWPILILGGLTLWSNVTDERTPPLRKHFIIKHDKTSAPLCFKYSRRQSLRFFALYRGCRAQRMQQVLTREKPATRTRGGNLPRDSYTRPPCFVKRLNSIHETQNKRQKDSMSQPRKLPPLLPRPGRFFPGDNSPQKSAIEKSHQPPPAVFPYTLYISTQSGNIVVTISPFVSGRRHSLTPVLEMTKQRGVACIGIYPTFRDGSPSFSPSSSYDDSAPCHLNSSNCPKDQKFVALQHCENEDSASKAAPSAYSRNMPADINTCSSEALYLRSFGSSP